VRHRSGRYGPGEVIPLMGGWGGKRGQRYKAQEEKGSRPAGKLTVEHLLTRSLKGEKIIAQKNTQWTNEKQGGEQVNFGSMVSMDARKMVEEIIRK